MTLWLPPADDDRRRAWLMAPKSSPTVSIDDVSLEPKTTAGASPRWLDYGTAELPLEFTQLRVRGMPTEERLDSHLLVTAQLDFSPEGCSLEDAERKLRGLARCDAGSTTLAPNRITAGSPTTFVVRYTAGPKGLPDGAEVRFCIPKAFTTPQTEHPGNPGFLSVGPPTSAVSIIDIGQSPESHEKADVICRLQNGLGPGEGFDLSYSTEKTYIFPCRFRETDGRYWYTKLPPLTAAVAVSPDAPFISLDEKNGHILEVIPGPAERLHLFLPGLRHSSEKLSLRGILTDRYRNISPQDSPMPDIELFLIQNTSKIALGKADTRFTAPHRFEIPLPNLQPGIYRGVALDATTGEEIASSNPLEIIDETTSQERLFWGEIHAHTEMSDGSGDFSELYRHARHEGCLDFAAAADHACYFSDNEWLTMQDITNTWNAPGEFVTLNGYEWAGMQVHRNIYTSRDRLKLFRGMYPPTSNIDAVWQHFHGDDEVVGGPHAPLAHGLIWKFHDPTVERFVEIYSMWGACDFRDSALVPDWITPGGREMTVNEILQTGAKLGFTGGGDCHEGHAGFSSEDPDGQGKTSHTFAVLLLYRCGMTAAMMPELNRSSLISAIRNRRTYATTGARILLDFTAGGFPMGAEGQARNVECTAAVHGVARIREIRIIKDGTIAWSRQFDTLDVETKWLDPHPPSQEHYYYLQVIQIDGEMAWSSPVWIRPIG